jgi:hypothetical protein
MKRKIFGLVLSGIVLFSFSEALAQNYAETALLFSRTRPGGSARIQALGGSQTALGGDYSSAASNPAGLGMFNRSEFTFSAGLGFHNMSSYYLDNSMSTSKTSLNIPGLSLVWHMPKESGSFLGGSFAISVARTNDFNRETIYSAFNDQSSIIDYFIDQANGSTTTQFDEGGAEYNTPTGLAYFNYLIGAKSIILRDQTMNISRMQHTERSRKRSTQKAEQPNGIFLTEETLAINSSSARGSALPH